MAAVPVAGRITHILKDGKRPSAFIILDVFQISSVRDEYFGMPVLMRRFDETILLMIPTQVSLSPDVYFL